MRKFENFKLALRRLEEFHAQNPSSDLEKTGFIQAFNYTFETAWKFIQYLGQQGGYDCGSPRSSVQAGIVMGLIPVSFKDAWLSMLADRNLAVHTYQDKILNELPPRIVALYLPAFLDLAKKTTH